MMRRVRYYEYGSPEVLTVEESEVPEPAAGQVQVATEVVGASYVDTAMRQGTSALGQPPLPGSPHGDVVGVVEALGAGVEAELLGQRVVGLAALDAYADKVLLDADWLVEVPADISAEVASVLSMPAPVALRALRTGQLARGETVLVHAAAGGIGHLATQLARIEGAARVIATASSLDKADFIRSHGADVVINYADDDWVEQVRMAAPDGVDVILDSVGGKVTAQSLDVLAPFGRLVIFGAAAGMPELPVAGLLGLHTVSGFGIMQFRAARPELARSETRELVELARSGQLRVAVSGSVPLGRAADAHALLEDRSRTGRVLLVP